MRAKRKREGLSRREFLAAGAVVAASGSVVSGADEPTHRQASGVKVGEVTDTSAIVWTRHTANGSLAGSFRTAVQPDVEAEITFAVVTCQMYADLDHEDGFHIYPAIRELGPRFVAFTGDNVYYDSERPRAVTPALTRYHWQRMYSLPRHVELLRGVATYWEKDDHDTLKNDSWAGQKMGDLTFAEGQRIFRQQVPLGETIYRTFRWGKFLQVWLTDGRDFRSPNSMKGGPGKTIWGQQQKAWLFRTLRESDAAWKVVISPTPVVGPGEQGRQPREQGVPARG